MVEIITMLQSLEPLQLCIKHAKKRIRNTETYGRNILKEIGQDCLSKRE